MHRHPQCPSYGGHVLLPTQKFLRNTLFFLEGGGRRWEEPPTAVVPGRSLSKHSAPRQALPHTEVTHSTQGLLPPLRARSATAGLKRALKLTHSIQVNRDPSALHPGTEERNKQSPTGGRRAAPGTHTAPRGLRAARPFPGGRGAPPVPPAAFPRPREGRGSALRSASLAARRALTAAPGPLRLRPPPARTKAPTAAAARRRRKARR